jgi:hypothetical protein
MDKETIFERIYVMGKVHTILQVDIVHARIR